MNDDHSDFIESLGPGFLAHLLRRISDELVEADKLWNAEKEVPNPPRTASTLLALDARGAMSVTELAATLRQSHQLVQQWIAELDACGLIHTRRDPEDRRRSIVALTPRGNHEIQRLRDSIIPVAQANLDLLTEGLPGIYEALWRIERSLRSWPFIERIRAADRARRGE